MAMFFSLWWRHQIETFSALLAICAGNSQVPGEFPTQRPVTRSFDVFPDLRLNKWFSKQSWGWWFETLSRPIWRHRNVLNSPGEGIWRIIRNISKQVSVIRESDGKRYDSGISFSVMSPVYAHSLFYCRHPCTYGTEQLDFKMIKSTQ